MIRGGENKGLPLPVRCLFAMEGGPDAATTADPALSSHEQGAFAMPFRAVTGGFRQLQAAGGAQ